MTMTRRKHKYSGTKLSRGEPPNFSGQHFLHKPGLIREIVDRAQIGSEDTVLELGAGAGALTTLLSERAGKVLAVEYDEKLIDTLKRKTAAYGNTVIIHQNILNLRLPKGKFHVVANIPYAITTPIMKLLLNRPTSGFQRGVIVMEKGAAKRFTSPYVKNAYVLVWKMWFDLRLIKEISRECFSPPPKVESAMVKITRRPKPIIGNQDRMAFIGLAEYALKVPTAPADDVLRGIFTPIQIKHLKRSSDIRGDQSIGSLTVQQWGGVFHTMTRHVPRPYWPRLSKKQLEQYQ